MKWKPSKTQRQAFAAKMQDPTERQAYEDRKSAKADKRRAGSIYDYNTAGGYYTPTKDQYDTAMSIVGKGIEDEAANMVIFGYSCGEKVHHDFIHRINEFNRQTI